MMFGRHYKSLLLVQGHNPVMVGADRPWDWADWVQFESADPDMVRRFVNTISAARPPFAADGPVEGWLRQAVAGREDAAVANLASALAARAAVVPNGQPVELTMAAVYMELSDS